MSKTLFTSDLHLDDKDSKVAAHRGFACWQDHVAAIALRWSITVSSADKVWVLGDLATSSDGYALDLLASLPGEKHLVLGNHDAGHPMHRNAHKNLERYRRVFASVQSAARLRISGVEGDVLLSHFPYERDHKLPARHMQWRLPNRGAWLLHGHTHGTERVTRTAERYGTRLHYPAVKELHVGLDAWDLRPVELDEVRRLMAVSDSLGRA